MPQLPAPLPTNRAFVVQFRAQPPGAPLSWDGRVEHVVSGQMTHFHALDELLAFLRRVLAGVSALESASCVPWARPRSEAVLQQKPWRWKAA
jgi:hypothetical protein